MPLIINRPEKVRPRHSVHRTILTITTTENKCLLIFQDNLRKFSKAIPIGVSTLRENFHFLEIFELKEEKGKKKRRAKILKY